MAEIPESLSARSAEAKAKALGLPVEQVLAEMKGEAPPTPPMAEAEPNRRQAEETVAEEMRRLRAPRRSKRSSRFDDEPAPAEVAAGPAAETEPEVVADTETDVPPAPPTEAPPIEDSEEALTPPASAEPSDAAGPRDVELPPPRCHRREDRPALDGDGAGTARAMGPAGAMAPGTCGKVAGESVHRAAEGDSGGSADPASAHGGQARAIQRSRPSQRTRSTPGPT